MKSASIWTISDGNQTYAVRGNKSHVIWTYASAAAALTDRLRNPRHCDSHVSGRKNKVVTRNRRALMPLLLRSDLWEPCGIRGDNTRNPTSPSYRDVAASGLSTPADSCAASALGCCFGSDRPREQSQLKKIIT